MCIIKIFLLAELPYAEILTVAYIEDLFKPKRHIQTAPYKAAWNLKWQMRRHCKEGDFSLLSFGMACLHAWIIIMWKWAWLLYIPGNCCSWKLSCSSSPIRRKENFFGILAQFFFAKSIIWRPNVKKALESKNKKVEYSNSWQMPALFNNKIPREHCYDDFIR